MRLVPPLCLLALLWGHAVADDAADGVYRGILSCGPTRSSDAFEWGVVLAARNGRLDSETGSEGADGWEKLSGVIAADGSVTIVGQYISGQAKSIQYEGRLVDGHIRAQGRRGPRECTLDAKPVPDSGAQLPLLPAPDPESRRRLAGTARQSRFVCEQPPTPVRDLVVPSFYRRDDSTHSIVDPDALAERNRGAAPVRKFGNGISRMGDRWLGENPPPADVADCMASWLDAWAGATALLGRVSRQGASERKWTLATLSLNYALIRNVSAQDEDRRVRIEGWLRKLGWVMIPDYARKPYAEQNNHLNWAALSALATAIAVQDKPMFDWAIDAARGAISNIAADGSLPLELRRAKRSVHYHVFALQPLVLAAEIAAANGIDLYTVDGGALHRLVDFARAVIADPALVGDRVGVPQEMPFGAQSAGLYAWMEPYVARFGTANAPAALVDARKNGLDDVRLGGNLTLRFGPIGAR